MVNISSLALLLLSGLLCGFYSQPALGIFSQTKDDLAVMEDTLRDRFGDRPDIEKVTPLLVAPPQHYWKESRSDFASQVYRSLQEVFQEPGDLISCLDCDTWRLHVPGGEPMQVHNGELSLQELRLLQENSSYQQARSFASVKETPSGVEIRITSLTDGKILFFALADSSKDLDDYKPYLNFSQEKRRREEGKGLSYVFLNLGIYPDPQIQTEFVEQWGSRNQHISGVGISLIGPEFAIGAVYHWMFPSHRKAHIGGAIYYPLQNVFQDEEDLNSATQGLVVQASLQYTIGASYGVYIGGNSDATFTLGFNFYNPILMPFLL